MPVAIEFFGGLFQFYFRERLITPSIFPAIAPAIPRWEYRTAANPDTIVHRCGERVVSAAIEHTCLQRIVGCHALFFSTAAPIRDVVIETTVAPKRPVIQCAIREKAASIAAEFIDI